MKFKSGLMALLIAMSMTTYGIAADELTAQEQVNADTATIVENAPVEIGNKICPVSGNKAGAMGPVVKFEYASKIYNLCCEGCIATFKADPEKYIKIVEEEMAQLINTEADEQQTITDESGADEHPVPEITAPQE